MSHRRLAAALLASSLTAAGQTASQEASGAVLETPTLHSIGIHWVVSGEQSVGARVEVAYRAGDAEWRQAAPLFRVEEEAQRPRKGAGASVEVPPGASLFAGSLLLLKPGTEYEVRLSLRQTNKEPKETILKTRTRAEPLAPENLKTLHVIPGDGGGTGTSDDPLRGLKAAEAKAAPGTLFLLGPGTYPPFTTRRSGEPGKPIIWRSVRPREAVIDAGGQKDARILSADNTREVWFEGLTLTNGGRGLVAQEAAGLVLRRCHIHAVEYGIVATRNDSDQTREWFVSDNVIEGPSTWPRTKGIENARGIQLTGEGHVVCYNRIRGFADAINTFPSRRCASIDFHNNEISEMTDDGIELDFSERNVRCFDNRLTDVFQGISTQPVLGGPAYIFRNAMYNVVAEPFKLHNSPSGCLFYHNTVVKSGTPFFVQTPEPVSNSRTRNNLFIGTGGKYALEIGPKMRNCDFDHDGVSAGTYAPYLKWNGVRYATLEEVRQKAPVWKHCIAVENENAFASGAKPPEDPSKVHAAVDLRLSANTAAKDAGVVLPELPFEFAGNAPDLGAYEAGKELPQYGPRPSLHP